MSSEASSPNRLSTPQEIQARLDALKPVGYYVKFGELPLGALFECFGDEHVRYDYPKWCHCVKYDQISGMELLIRKDNGAIDQGILFLMDPRDKVWIPGDKIVIDMYYLRNSNAVPKV